MSGNAFDAHGVEPNAEGAVPTRDTDGTVAHTVPARSEVLDRQKERFGGFKWGAAFFGWLTATCSA